MNALLQRNTLQYYNTVFGWAVSLFAEFRYPTRGGGFRNQPRCKARDEYACGQDRDKVSEYERRWKVNPAGP